MTDAPDNLVPMPGRELPVAFRGGSPAIIAALEALLARARGGDVVAFAFCWRTQNAGFDWQDSLTTSDDAGLLVAALHCCAHAITKRLVEK